MHVVQGVPRPRFALRDGRDVTLEVAAHGGPVR